MFFILFMFVNFFIYYFVFNDSSLRLIWSYRVWVVGGCIMVLIFLVKLMVGVVSLYIWFEFVLVVLVGYILVDFGFGVYYWGIDNYGDVLILIFGI